MFGGPKFGSPFGQNQQSTFGKPAAFGSTSFGQQSNLFTQPTTSVFGQPAAPTFGATASTFGQTATTQSAFGSFGQQPQQQQSAPSLFGQTQGAQASTSLFGQPSTSTGFGVAKPTGFGFNTNQGTLFGQSSTSTANTGFGTFGNTATSAFSSPQTMAASGTAIAKYQPHSGTDTLMKNGQTNSVSTRQHCITAMKEYEGKSLEELRLEDYLANRKGPQGGAVQPGGLFGTTPQNTSIFGAPASQPQSTGLFGAQSTTNTLGGFGANTSTFGQTAPAFGAQNQTASLFNKPANTFGQSTFNQQPANNLFGAKPFGAPTTTATTGFSSFGASQANTTTPFGAAKPFGQPTTGLFGATAPAATGPSFGANTASFGAGGFGATAPPTSQPGSLFGQPAPAGSTLFGLSSSAPNTGFGGFGSTTNTAAGGLFGQKQTTGFGSSFGAPASSTTTGFSGLGTFTPAGGSAFGTFGQTSSFNKPAGTGFTGFGASSTAPVLSGFGGLGSNTMGFGGASTSLQPAQQTTVPVHQHILSLATSPFGDNPIFKDLKPVGSLNEDALKPTNPAAQKALLESSSNQNQYKISPKVSNGLKIKPVASTLSKKSLFGGLEESDSTIEESFSLKPNAKRLIIKPKVSTPSNLTPNPNHNTSVNISKSQDTSPTVAEERRSTQLSNPLSEPENNRRASWLHSNLDKVSQQNRGDIEINSTIQELVSSSGKSKTSNIDKLNTSPGILRQDLNRSNISSLQHKSVHFPGLGANDSIFSSKSFLDDTNTDISLINTDPHPASVVLQRSGYYTIPPLDKLADFMTDDGKCVVPYFTIGRKGYGNVYFGEPIDVAGLNLDDIVHFRHKEVIIYPDDENKPPVGEGLNRKAQITLDQVWPHDKTLHEPIKDRERLEEMNYEAKLRAVCDKHDTRFVEYRPETGSWVFKVDHFSKYGLSDSDEEDNVTEPKKLKPNQPGKDGLKSKLTGTLAFKPKDPSALQRDSLFCAPNKFHITRMQSLNPCNELDFAMDMETDLTKVQVMRSSFFGANDDDADEYETKSVTFDHYGGDRDSLDQIVPNKRLFTFSSTHSMLSKEVSSTTSSSSIETPILSPPLPMIREEPKKSELLIEAKKLIMSTAFKPIPFLLKPKIATIRATDKVVPLADSVQAKLLGKSIASDMALYHGRRFKVGWSHANCLTILTTAMTGRNLNQMTNLSNVSLFSGRSQNDTSKSIVKQVKIFSIQSKDEKTFIASIENHLECQLNFSQRQSIADSDCPHLVPINGVEALQQHYLLTKQNFGERPLNEFEKVSLNVWSLLVTLWGYQEELEEATNDEHFAIMLRRDLFSKWLEDTVTDKNLLKRTESQGPYLQNLLNLLTAHKVIEACELAFSNNDMNLSLLLAQIGGNKIVRALLAKQLQSWQETEADKFIDIHRIKAMMLVAGIPTYESSQGPVNIYDGLEWIKSLAINTWYLCSPTASITDALIKYEDATIENAAQPSPAYVKNYNIGENMDRIQDIRYHILKLYSKRSHSLEKLLNPATHTADFMDFRLSWMLLQVLKSIGYQHCSAHSEAQLHVSFASQLENYGLWHWSIFVLLHIPNKSQRELAIQQMLYRYIDLTKDDGYRAKESFIVNRLGIPEKWIYWAKAVKAGSLKQYREQADYLLKAKQWALAHEVIMREIAPDAIINDNTRYIKDLLDRFEDPRLVPNWTNQGMVILDYLDMTTKIESLKTIHERDIETRWEGLKPQLSELCSRINQFPCPTSKHRLCQSEIAQDLAILVNGMEILSSDINPCLLVKTALEKLPLPEEYAKQKMRSLLDNSNFIEMLQNDEH